MSGSIQSISFGGVSYNVPIDQEVTINLGGTVSKEYTTYGNGTTRGKKVPDPGLISGIIVEIEDKDKLKHLQEQAALSSIDVSVTDAEGKSQGGAGQIIAESGINKNKMTGNLNDEIQVVAKGGKFDEL